MGGVLEESRPRVVFAQQWNVRMPSLPDLFSRTLNSQGGVRNACYSWLDGLYSVVTCSHVRPQAGHW